MAAPKTGRGPEIIGIGDGLRKTKMNPPKPSLKSTFRSSREKAREIGRLVSAGQHREAVAMCAAVVKRLKKMDEKEELVEVLLAESKAYHAMGNLAKSRVALVTSRTFANSIYITPTVQAALDLQFGIIHAAEDKDFKTAFSYFFEAFDNFNAAGEAASALCSLKYMLLSKIMLGHSEEVSGIMCGKEAAKYAGPEISAMIAVAAAAKAADLAAFLAAFAKWEPQLRDPVVTGHFEELKETMLEANITRIVQPYTRVQIDHIAKKLGADQAIIERKLSMMLLEGKMSGVIDQAERNLILFPKEPEYPLYKTCLAHIKATDKLLDSLFQFALKLN